MPHTLIPHLRRPPSIATLARVTTIAALVALPIAATAQLGAGVARATKLEPTSMSALAISEFNSAMNDLSNAQVIRGTEHLRRALAADPALGVARAFYGFNAAGLTRTQRELELDRAVTDALRGSTPELLLATAMRARFRGDLVQTQSLMRSAAQILPNDPTIAFQVAMLSGQVPGNRYTDAIAPMRTLTTRFPEFAPSHNLLAYSLFRSGERAAALEMVQLYVAKAPNEPNPHDSYGELLQWSGRLTDAATEYQRALAIDPTFTGAALGIAEVRVLEGKTDLARTAISEAIPRLTTSTTRVAYLRQIASTYVLDGNAKAAMTQLALVIDEAKTGNVPNAVNSAHVSMAMIDAMIGDGKAVGTHLAMLDAEMNVINRAYFSGFSYALAKQNTLARTSLEELKRLIVGNENEGNVLYVPILTTLVLMNDGKADEAVTTMNRTDLTTPISRAVLAIAQQQAGNLGIARSLRDEILGDRVLNLDNGAQITARRLVKRIN